MSEHPIRLVVSDDLRRRRLTVFFRLLLAVPHYIWATLWTIVAFFAAIANWLATLLIGRSPTFLHRFLAAYVKYITQFYAYLHLIADAYPAFDGQAGYPIDVTIAPPSRQRRLRVLLRLPLAVPAILIGGVLLGSSWGLKRKRSSTPWGLLSIVAFLAWFACLIRARMPRGLRDAGAYSLSYGAQLWAYLLLLTESYPDSDPLAALHDLPAGDAPIHLRGTDDLRRSRLTVLFRLPLSVPHIIWLALWGILVLLAAILNWIASLILGRSPAWLHRFLAAYVRYQLSVYAFLYLVANPFPGFGGKAGRYPLDAVIAEPRSQRRWTVLLRLLLALPALAIYSAYSSLNLLRAILSWFAALALGRIPRGLRNAGALALRYGAQTHGYLLLLTDVYPYSGPCESDRPAESPADTSSWLA